MRSKDKGLMERILTYVEDYAMDNMGETPKMRDVGKALGVSHVSVIRYLRAMDELGMIRYENGKVHTDKIDKISIKSEASVSFPFSVPAGIPEELENLADEYIFIPEIFTGNHAGKFFVIQISGDSMVDAGIDPGDIVIMKQQVDYREDDIIMALIEGSNTLKRVLKDEKCYYLWAENESWSKEKRIYGRNFTSQGVAIRVVKEVK